VMAVDKRRPPGAAYRGAERRSRKETKRDRPEKDSSIPAALRITARDRSKENRMATRMNGISQGAAYQDARVEHPSCRPVQGRQNGSRSAPRYAY